MVQFWKPNAFAAFSTNRLASCPVKQIGVRLWARCALFPIYLHNICSCQGSIWFLVQCKRWWTYQSTLVKTFTNSLAGTGLKGTPDHHHQHRWSSGNICVNIILSTLDIQWTQVNLKPNSPCAFPPNQAPSIKTGGMFLRHRLPISCSVAQYSPADVLYLYCICIYKSLMAPASSQLGLVWLSKLKLGSSELKLRRILTFSVMSIGRSGQVTFALCLFLE